jgi:hypothetical protein
MTDPVRHFSASEPRTQFPQPVATPSADVDPWVEGEAIWYRLYDVGYEIRLDQASEALASSAPERPRPIRGEAQAIQIANPPVTVNLGTDTWSVSSRSCDVELSARLFDFGVVSLRARLAFPSRMRWSEFVSLGVAMGFDRAGPRFDAVRQSLVQRVRSAIDRPGDASVVEEYVVFRIGRIDNGRGEAVGSAALDDERIARLLTGETRPLSAAVRKDQISQRFTYFEDDLAVLTWNAALVVEPNAEDTDVQYVLEFANAQLLEVRYHDSILDVELPRMYDEVAAARRGFHVLGRRYSRLLSSLQTRMADATEAVERAENSLKVTDDVFLARIYAAALEIFRERTWRAGIDRKVTILRSTYEILNAESQARRTEILELIVILLIALEIILALRGH